MAGLALRTIGQQRHSFSGSRELRRLVPQEVVTRHAMELGLGSHPPEANRGLGLVALPAGGLGGSELVHRDAVAGDAHDVVELGIGRFEVDPVSEGGGDLGPLERVLFHVAGRAAGVGNGRVRADLVRPLQDPEVELPGALRLRLRVTHLAPDAWGGGANGAGNTILDKKVDRRGAMGMLFGALLAWDVVVLNGYLMLNLAIPFYLLYSHFTGRTPEKGKYVPWIYVSVFWAVSIHLVTAFLFAGLPARPFWHNALLGPRFLASAFAAGPAIMILVLWFIRSSTEYEIKDGAFTKLAMIVTVAAQINLIMLASEVFTEFYFFTHHAVSARYLFFGLDGNNALVPWIWTAITMNVGATVILTIHPLRRNPRWLIPACLLLFAAIWTEKGMGMVIPGFIPSPLGEIVEYAPTWVELGVTAGIWAMGMFVLTVLVRVALPIELGHVRSPHIRSTAPADPPVTEPLPRRADSPMR